MVFDEYPKKGKRGKPQWVSTMTGALLNAMKKALQGIPLGEPVIVENPARSTIIDAIIFRPKTTGVFYLEVIQLLDQHPVRVVYETALHFQDRPMHIMCGH